MDWSSLGLTADEDDVQGSGRGRGADIVRHTPDASKYHKMGKLTMIPAAAEGRGGMSLGDNPNNPATNVVRIVDIDTPSNSIDLDLAALTPDIVDRAAAAAASSFHGEMAMIASCHMARKLADGQPTVPRTANGRVARPRMEPPVKFADQGPDAHGHASAVPEPAAHAHAPAPAFAAGPGLIASFNAAKLAAPPAAADASGRQVTFDFGQGDFRAPFKEAFVSGLDGTDMRILVLIVDERSRGVRFVPKPSAAEFAVATDNSDEVHMCTHLGIEFRRGEETTVVLVITKSSPRS